LYLQVGANYVNSELTTPVSSFTDAVLAAQNNYWSLNANAGFVVDDQTDLNLGYTYYRADNFTDNTPDGIPFGSGAEEHGINATVIRRINKNLRASCATATTPTRMTARRAIAITTPTSCSPACNIGFEVRKACSPGDPPSKTTRKFSGIHHLPVALEPW
jgi:hypothetical protein